MLVQCRFRRDTGRKVDRIIHFRQLVLGHIVKTPAKRPEPQAETLPKRDRESLSIRANPLRRLMQGFTN